MSPRDGLTVVFRQFNEAQLALTSCGACLDIDMRKTITPYTLSSISVLSYYIEVSEMGEISRTEGKREGFGGET